MPEHYTKNTVEASAYCKPCGKFTAHRIDGGRLGPCLPCIKRLENPTLPGIVEPAPEQLTIAGVYGSIEIG